MTVVFAQYLFFIACKFCSDGEGRQAQAGRGHKLFMEEQFLFFLGGGEKGTSIRARNFEGEGFMQDWIVCCALTMRVGPPFSHALTISCK